MKFGEKMIEKISNGAKKCIETLENAGFECYIVGGAIRDILMGLEPGDFDITTNATPDDVINLFPKTIPTGIDHGTVTVVIDDENLEVTTYRNDGEYSDHRSPESVEFISSIDADLSRRDFTINAICYNPKTDIYDPLCGRNDIALKTIRAIGDPHKRYYEDALRILRAFRFSAQLGFEIEENTFSAAIRYSYLLTKLSRERIFSEFKKTLIADKPTAINPLIKHGAFNFLMFNNTEIPKEVEALPKIFALRFAYLKNTLSLNTTTILMRLKSDKKTVVDTNQFDELFASPYETRADIKRMLKYCSVENVRTYLEYLGEDKIKTLDDILSSNEPYCLSMLNIDGNDIEALGYKGREIGKILNFVLLYVIDNPKENIKENLIEYVSKNF